MEPRLSVFSEIIDKRTAMARDLKSYFTGAPCKHGHIARRSIYSGSCEACVKVAHAKQRESQPDVVKKRNADTYQRRREKALEVGRIYAQKNKRRIAERMRAYNAANAARSAERHRQWREGKSEELKAKAKAYREANKDHAKRYYEANKSRYIHRNRLRQKHVSVATPSWADLYRIAALYQTAGALTELTGVRHVVDHMVPLKGKNVCGLHVEANLRVITAEQNAEKGNKLLECYAH